MWVLRRTELTAALVGIVALVSVTGRADDARVETKKTAAPTAAVEYWEGTLKVVPGVEMRLVVNVKTDDKGAKVATLDSPDEGLEGMKLGPFSVDDKGMAFDLKVTSAKYEGKFNADGTEIVWDLVTARTETAAELQENENADSRPQDGRAPSRSGKGS